MEFYDDADFVDDDHFVEIPCEFCGKLIALIVITEHQTGCPLNPDNVQMPNEDNLISFDDNSEKSTMKNQIEVILPENSLLKKVVLPKEKAPSKEKVDIEDFPEFRILEDTMQEIPASLSFGSMSNTDEKIEEEKPNFKISPIPLLNSREMKNQIHNVLSESDNEEGESLEEFWKKANIKLSQRLRELGKKGN